MAEEAARLDPEGRAAALAALAGDELQVLVIGGGVVGAGVALDAVTRGLSVGLVEARDFASGTSSRSSKLIHGGLRYLEQLNFEPGPGGAARARRCCCSGSPRTWSGRCRSCSRSPTVGWERAYVGAGLALYDTLGFSLGPAARAARAPAPVTKRGALRLAPALKRSALTGALQYWDAQVDDARYVVTLLRTAASYGATDRLADPGRRASCARGSGSPACARCATWRAGGELEIRAQQVVNATGVWTDDIQAHGGRSRADPRPRLQGHPPGGAARPDPLAHRASSCAPRSRAVRHPVGPALDHRHHRHRVDAGQGPSGGQPRPTSTTCSTRSTGARRSR